MTPDPSTETEAVDPEREERLPRIGEILAHADSLPRNPNPEPELEWDEDGLPL